MFSSSNILEGCTGDGNGGALYIAGDNAIISADFRFNNATGNASGNDTGKGGSLYVAGNNVTITESTFFTTCARDDGGALYITGQNGKLSNSTFTNNFAGDDGGAIYWEGSNGTIYNITCNDNRAISSTGSSNGGTICITGSNVTVDKSSFNKTHALISGGAIFATGNNVTISDTSFANCNVSMEIADTGKTYVNGGGAIYVLGNSSNIINCTFENTNGREGGALYIQGNNVTIENITSTSTNAKNGGSIYVSGQNAMILDSNITQAHATSDGGGLNIVGNHVEVINCTVEDCTSGSKTELGNGAGIYISGNGVDIEDSRFKNCVAPFEDLDAEKGSQGGAIYVAGNDVEIINDTIEECLAYQAGGVYILGNNALINMSSFTSNNGSDDGGALYVAGQNGSVYNSNFTHNIAGDDGGAIYWTGSNGFMYNITCNDNKAISSTGNSNGGTICLTGSNITIDKSSFNKTYALISGGAVFITGNYINITDTTFTNCNVSMDIEETHKDYVNGGGAIYVLGNNTYLLNCSFENNNAREGGSIYIQGNDVKMDRLKATDNYAKNGGTIYVAGENANMTNSNITQSHSEYGGAIYIEGDFAYIFMSDFTNNNASGKGITSCGGAIYIRGANTNILRSYFLNDTAIGGDGGSIYIGGYNANIEKSNFKNSNAYDGEGGAIFVAGNLAHVHDSTFNQTQAGDGGAIYIGGFRTGEDAKILNCTITNSIATEDGGAIYIAGQNALISVDVSDTKAAGLKNNTGYGGAIYVGGDDANITVSSFNNCSAGVNASGGAIYVEGDYANIEKSTFNNTYAKDGELASGGAIAIEGNMAVVSDSNFTECFAYNGGVLFVEGRRATLLNSNVSDCYAYSYGGAIYILDGEKTRIEASNFDNCTSITTEGGAIFIDGDFTVVLNSNFTNCNASSKDGLGGGIYILGEETSIQNATFDRCTSVDGGAIYIEGNDAHISDSNFIGNVLVNYTDDDNYGGAIYINGERTVISTSTFENHSAYTGGSVYINGTDTTILDSDINNSTAEYGGAVFIQGLNAKIKGGDISNCSCKYDGGAIYVNGTNAEISADFVNCNASSITTPDIKGNGGAIYVNGTNTNVHDSTFLNCTAMNGGYGGAIYIEGVDTTVQTSRFENTKTSDEGKGGAIYIEGSRATVTTSEFINTHSREGGAIYIEGINTTVTDTVFTETNVGTASYWGDSSYSGGATDYTAPIAGNGGAIYIWGPNTYIKNATIDSSYATQRGGAIYVEGHDAKISANIHESHAGLTDTSTNFNVNNPDYKVDVQEIRNMLNDMVSTYAVNVTIYNDNLSTIKNNAKSARDDQNNKVDNILNNKNVFNQAVFDAVLANVLEINTTLSYLESESPLIYDSLIGYYNNIYADLIEINTSRDWNEFNGHIRNDIRNNLTAIIKFVDYCNELGGDLGRGSNDAKYLQNNDKTYAAVNSRLVKLQDYYEEFKGDINNLIGYNSGFNYLVDYNEAFGIQVNKTYDSVNALHDQGIKGEGGAIYVNGTNTLIYDSIMSKTHADNNGDGGAVFVAGVNTTVRDSSFDESKATDGGAVYVTGSETSIMNSNFTNTISTNNGGGIYVAGHNTYISGDSFDKSKAQGTDATDGGGAMYIVGDGTYVSDSNFTLSDSSRYGGAIYIAGKNTDILRSNFIQNHASSPGGAVYIQSNLGLNTTVDDCYFFDNSAGGSGGALHVSGTNTTVNNTVFIKNHGVSWGGAIYINGINATVQYTNLSENTASSNGGAIYWQGGHGGDSIIGCIIFNNSATSYDSALGGGVFWSVGNDVTPGGLVKDTIFDSNYAGKHGGGMDWYRTVNSTMENCTFINNVAGKDGGGFYCGDTSAFEVSTNLTLINSKFINNTANYAGGGASIQMRSSHIVNCLFDDNIAYFGGSIVIKDSKTTYNEIINCTFINSTASTTFINSTVQSIIDHYKDLDEFCKGKGGAIFARDNYISVINSTFIDGNAKYGGAIFWDGGENYQSTDPSKKTGTLGIGGVINNSTFIGNNATQGGAVMWTSPDGIIANSTFRGNNASEGGAVYWKGGVEYIAYAWNYKDTFAIHGNNGKVVNSEFSENTATKGGAIYWTAEKGNVSNSVFTDNYAELGGAIYWQNITETANTGNRAIYYKTASTGRNGVVENSTFFANKANYDTGKGGAIYWNTSSSNITDTTFLNNTASNGGAIYWVNGTKVDNSTFRFNKAHTGSAMYFDSSMKEMDIIDSSFLENRADSNRFEDFKVENITNGASTTGVRVSAYFIGNDNIINAMYNNGGEVYFTNVDYLGVDGTPAPVINNTGNSRVTPVKISTVPPNSNTFYQTDYEKGQIVKIVMYDLNGLVYDGTLITDDYGKVSLEQSGLDDSVKMKMEHPADDYYTYLGINHNIQMVFIDIETADIECLDDEIINLTVYPQNKSETRAPTRNLTVKVIGDNGLTYEVNVTLTPVENTNRSIAQVTVPKCPTGYYSVMVHYYGDDYYIEHDNSSSFRARGTDPTIVIDTEDIWVGQMEIINITVDPTKKVTGNVSVYIDSVYFGDLPLVNGTIQIRDNTFPVGRHNVIGIYNGDEHFKLVRNTSSFLVKKYTPYFVIHAQDILVDQTEFIWIELPKNATGFVYLKVNGEPYYINLTAGERNITLPAFAHDGIYDVWGNYSGDGYWNSVINTTQFRVSKHNITLNITDVVKIYGESEKANITFNVTDATGNVTIKINGTLKVYENVTIVGGKATVDISGLDPGNYTMEVIYLGDRKYNGNTTSGKLTVKRAKIPIYVDTYNIYYGEKEHIIAHVNTTGSVTFRLNGTVIGDDSLARGVAEYDTRNDLLPGIYTVNATFSGNKYYEPGWNISTYEVYKLNRTIVLNVYDIIYGNLEELRVFVNATGNVTIKVNGTEKTIVLDVEQYGAIDRGKASWILEGLDVGTYPVEVTYNGNNIYNPNSTSGVFRVIPLNTTLDVRVHDIYVWDSEYLNVTVKDLQGKVIKDAPGNITITVNGVTYSEKLYNGVARFVIPGLSVGYKDVWAFYDGDKNHVGNRSDASFVVKQRVPPVSVEGEDIKVGQVETIHVKIPANATGFVIITGNFSKNGIYVANFENGMADIPVYNLANGTYSVHIKYYGDALDNYTTAEASDTFTVSKNNTPINIEVEDIFYKEIANITVSVDNDATGLITVKVVNGSGVVKEATLPIMNGKVNLLVDNLAVDTYTVYANYSGNYKYNVNQTSKAFKVKKIAPVITIDSVETNSIRNATVVVHITPGTTGNVTITVNNKQYSSKIENGVATFVIDQLNSGNYTVYADYPGDRNFTDAHTHKDNAVNIFRYSCYVMNVTAEDTKVDLNTTIIVNVPCDAVGEVAIYINGSFIANVPVDNGVAKLNVTKSIYGKYVVNATFMDGKYANKTVTTNYHVFKWDTPMIINVTDIYVGDIETIVVSVPDDIKNNVTIEIDGKTYSGKVINGNATFKVANLTYGNKTVTSIYGGNYKYLFNATTNNFTVYKRPSTLIVNTTEIHVDDVAIINVTVPQNATGYVIVSVNGTNYTVNLTGGKGSLSVPGLDSGIYNINATYLGDEQYLSSVNSTTLKVSKVPSTVSAHADNITVGEKAIIEIIVPADATGNVTVTLDHKDYNVSVGGGKGILVVPGLKVGNYTVDVKYLGDRKYEDSSNATKFSVNKIKTDMEVIDNGNGTVTIVIPGNATGNVTVVVENKTFNGTVVNGCRLLTNVTPGVHNITVIYSGDENHTSEIINATVTVPRFFTPIKVYVADIYVGDVALINVTVPVNATGKIRIEIDGKEYFYPIETGIARFAVENLTAGVKTVYVSYRTDGNYSSNSTSGNFTVKKHIPVVTVDTTDINVGDIAVINVTAPVDVTKPLVVNVNNVDYSVNVTNGIGQLNVSGLDSGKYNVTVKYLGDDKYLTGSNDTSFTVSKVPSTVSAHADNITVGEKAIIEIIVPADATGNVTVTLDHKDYNVSVGGGKGILVVPGLKVGNYTVDVKYLGDRKYEDSSNATKFSVNKIKTDMEVIDNGNGTVTIVIPGNATGNVTVVVENKTFNGTVVNGTVTINLTNVTPGVHNITVIYSGDENHTSEIINATVTVPRFFTPISVNVTDIYVGDIAKINVTVPVNATGKIRIEIDGKEYYEDIIGGIARFNIANLTAGVKTVYASYRTDVNYSSNSTSAKFMVFKYLPVITINASDITVGEVEYINVTAPADVTRPVIVSIGGVDYSVNVTNGIGHLNISDLGGGKYNATVKYLGDDKYLAANNTTSFTVSKLPSTVSAHADNITVGEKAIIEIYVLADATGNVTVTLDHKDYNVPVAGGRGTLIVPGLKVGNYTVDVKYLGDRKYEESNNATKFSVNKINTQMEVIDNGNGTVTIVIPGNATGNVTVKVENKTFNGTVVNGTVTINLTNVTPGVHNITVIYSGDDNHTSDIINATVTVPRFFTPISVNVTDIYVGDIAKINVTVPANATGKIRIEINGKEYYEDIIGGVARFNIANLTAGVKTVYVSYKTDGNYSSNSTSANFTVFKYLPVITVSAINITVGELEIINVTAPADVTRPVIVSIGGVDYSVNITNGIGQLEVHDLGGGNYNVTAKYYGDDKYLDASNKTSCVVYKLPSTVSAHADNITVGEKAIIEISVLDDATGNVTVTLGGKDYNVTVGEGKGILVVPGLKVGNYTVEVKYLGDRRYDESSNTTKFSVNKMSGGMEVIDNGNGTVTIIIPGNATGNVTVIVENKTFNGTVVNGTVTIELTNVTPGVHNITVIYSGDDTHESEIVNTTVTIPLILTPIKVYVENIYVGDIAKINVTVPVNATGKIRIEIDGKDYYSDIDGGVARFRVENLTAGIKTVAVSYAGDRNFTRNFTTANFTVFKHKLTVTVDAGDIIVGDVALINVTAPIDVTRPVVVNVAGVDYAVNITNGIGHLSVYYLGGGEYVVTAKYLGDDKYLTANDTARFKVSKIPSTVSVTAENITFGEKEVIQITVPADATGNVTVTVDGKDYNVSVSEGKGILVVSGLKVDNYTVEVKYLGDRKYEESNNATAFTVKKLTTDEVIVIDNGNGTVTVIVPGNSTGNITIEVENKTFNGTLVNGTVTIELTNVTPGEHNITVIYSGDENHSNATVNATVTIPKLITPIKVYVGDIYVGDIARINVTVPDGAIGRIRIEIDAKEYFAPIENGVARFAVENLTAGGKTVYVSYVGDNNYTGNHTSGNFTVLKYTPVITVTASDIIVGDVSLINVTAPADVTRPVVVNVGGVDYAVNITGGIGHLNITGLDGGEYDVTARYLGDDKYVAANDTASFKVSKVPSTVSVTAENITFGEKEVIQITVPSDATGNVTVTVGGKDYNVSVSEGKGVLVVTGLKVGNYTVEVKYPGDRRYEESENSTAFIVKKLSADDIKVIDNGNGTVTVVVPGNATGNITIKIGNQTFNGTVVNGTAVIELTNVTPGEHNITVIYGGDEIYSNSTVNGTVTIPRLTTPIKVYVEDIYVGDIARINVTVPAGASGEIRIEINGKEYFAPIENGVARFNVENLTYGVKTVAVTYGGDESYVANFTTGNFTVYKRNSAVSAEVESVIVGEIVTIKVKVPTDATGQVLVDIDGVSQYYVNVTGGEGFVDVPYIPSGIYDVNLTYIGDDKYLSSTNKTVFDVNKVKPFVIPIAHDIIVGENEVIKLIVPSDATGNVTVVIDGQEYVFDLNEGTLGAYYKEGEKYIVAVSGGNGELVIEGLPVGEYVVSVRYNGDHKYTTADNTTTFKVRDSSDLDIIDLGNGTVVVKVPGNASGNITIVVENQTYTAPVINGTAIVDLTNVTPGEHNITVIYSGDDTHDPSVENATVNIPKLYCPIDVETENIHVGDVEVVKVTVPKDATGTITIEIDGKEYTKPVKDGKAVFEVEGLEFGNKTVAVKYSGDERYRDNYTTGQFEVNKLPTTITAKAHDIYVGTDEIIDAKVLPEDATGKVLVDINGVGYYGNITENGIAGILIPELPSGEYTAIVTYEGDHKYFPSTTTVKFTVTKLKTPINAAGDEIEEGESATVIVKVPEDATGTITIVVDGKKYTEEVENGKAVFKVPGLVKGDWDVDASYSGDKKYEANDTITDILVYRYEPVPGGNGTTNETNNTHPDNASVSEKGISLADYPTGNPILVLLLILITLGVTRRFKR
ncbi:polymorphic outer membrane protein repeat-containing protein [Methanobrevibacter millerae]|uniref:Polymorphic outer membrane protein repeat-containing protein n=2 Tax=Methanobrevibacter millerae TaxID=230361 RepID=A0A1G5W2Z1_9EURY|nr:polymorphic outer membrane protein repeat-containing protein [Methanobrevibacter millerae]